MESYTGQNELQNRNEADLEKLRGEASRTTDAYNALREIGAREEIDRMNRRQEAEDSVAAAIAVTPDGGSLSDAQVKYLNSQRGIEVDGGQVQNGQIVEAGFNPKTGGYGFVFANVDGNGNVSYRPQEIPRTEVYGMMSSRPEWFGADRVKALGASIQHDDASFTDDRLKALGTRYADMRAARSQQILNARANLSGKSGGFGMSLNGRAQQRVQVTDSAKGQLSELAAIKNFIDSTPELDENVKKALAGAYQNGIMQIAGRYAPQSPSGGGGGANMPQLNEDGTMMRLPDGTMIRKGQEYTNPQTGIRRIWNGGDPRNWTEIGGRKQTSGNGDEAKPSVEEPPKQKTEVQPKAVTPPNIDYSRLDPKTIGKFKTLFPEATDEEIGSGKYEREIRSIANRAGDTASESVFGERDKKFAAEKEAAANEAKIDRQRRLHEASAKIINDLKIEAERRGVQQGWPQWKIDEYRKRETSDRIESFARSIGMKRKFGGEWE